MPALELQVAGAAAGTAGGSAPCDSATTQLGQPWICSTYKRSSSWCLGRDVWSFHPHSCTTGSAGAEWHCLDIPARWSIPHDIQPARCRARGQHRVDNHTPSSCRRAACTCHVPCGRSGSKRTMQASSHACHHSWYSTWCTWCRWGPVAQQPHVSTLCAAPTLQQPVGRPFNLHATPHTAAWMLRRSGKQAH